jgi:hypothetical protein
LHVGNLQIVGWLNESDMEKFDTIDFELQLKLDCVGAEQMYQLLERRLGRLVKSLLIGDKSPDVSEDVVCIHTEIILERILAACPNLEHFDFQSSRKTVLDSGYNLPPSAFKNYKE